MTKGPLLVKYWGLAACLLALQLPLQAQEQLETGGQKQMPREWIDRDTGHKLVRLTEPGGKRESFYFHNNPFLAAKGKVGEKMVYHGTDAQGVRQFFAMNLQTQKSEQLTNTPIPKVGEILGKNRREVFYQSAEKVYATHVDTKKTRLVYTFPAGQKGSISTINADETILGGSFAGPEKEAIYKQFPEKSDYFNRIYDAKIPHTLFTVNLKSGELKEVHTENTWLGHIQFSPTDPNLLMFCQEGPWHKVDRIWTINLQNGEVQERHTRTMDMEIAGHEFFSRDGQTIWYDLQKPRGQTFFLAGVDLNKPGGPHHQYEMTRDEWSIHFNISPDQKLFAGDGGDPGQVAKAPDGMWIYLFRPQGDKLQSERLVNMKHHGYKLEPNVHFSPDGKWVIFRANFEGESQIYAVEIAKAAGL